MNAYRVYDVFTDQRYGGNQLAVFLDAERLPEAELQCIAAEFNFSEVTFVYPPADPAHTARVRIFTPTTEVGFAGHPTIGTAICLHDLGFPADMVLELGVGPIPCTVDAKRAAFTTRQTLAILSHPDQALVAACLGLPDDAIMSDTHPPLQATLGLPFVIAELTTRERLSACQPDVASLRKASVLHPAGLDFAIFAYVRKADQVDARMFAPLDNIPEDPATGSAGATLAALLRQVTGQPQCLTIRQGADMGRPSQISAHADADGVTVAGNAVLVMEGNLVR